MRLRRRSRSPAVLERYMWRQRIFTCSLCVSDTRHSVYLRFESRKGKKDREKIFGTERERERVQRIIEKHAKKKKNCWEIQCGICPRKC